MFSRFANIYDGVCGTFFSSDISQTSILGEIAINILSLCSGSILRIKIKLIPTIFKMFVSYFLIVYSDWKIFFKDKHFPVF